MHNEKSSAGTLDFASEGCRAAGDVAPYLKRVDRQNLQLYALALTGALYVVPLISMNSRPGLLKRPDGTNAS